MIVLLRPLNSGKKLIRGYGLISAVTLHKMNPCKQQEALNQNKLKLTTVIVHAA